MNVRVGLKKAEHWRIDALNCGVEEDSWKSFGLQRDQISQSLRKFVLNIHWKDWGYSWNFNTLATWWEELTHWKRPWCWERLKAGGKGDGRGRDGWMASPTWWTWVWVNSGSWWWTGKPGIHGVAKSQTRLSDWTELTHYKLITMISLVTICHHAIIIFVCFDLGFFW